MLLLPIGLTLGLVCAQSKYLIACLGQLVHILIEAAGLLCAAWSVRFWIPADEVGS